MIASDLFDVPVRDDAGAHLGWVVDLRFVLDGPPSTFLARARLHGLVVSPRTRTSFLGFERSRVRQPWPVAPLLRWLHRGTFLVHWPDVAHVPSPDDDTDPGREATVVLRPGYTRYEPGL
ncbi:PRC-barrel domain containing protein [Promicromonospora sp. NPDC057138]|uniref:PRC-barrel domain containing protein n=1 Tax=Promicromonospora sp. NPDC057138 TaxID=3346031 RepID=UPI003632A6ED